MDPAAMARCSLGSDLQVSGLLPWKGELWITTPLCFAPVWFLYTASLRDCMSQDTQSVGKEWTEKLIGALETLLCPHCPLYNLLRSLTAQNLGVESRQYWPLSVPRVSSSSLATRGQGLPSPRQQEELCALSFLGLHRLQVPGSQCSQWLLWTAGTQAESIWYPNSGTQTLAIFSGPLSCLPHKRRTPGCGGPSAVTQSHPVLIHSPAPACFCARWLEHGGRCRSGSLCPQASASTKQHQLVLTPSLLLKPKSWGHVINSIQTRSVGGDY